MAGSAIISTSFTQPSLLFVEKWYAVVRVEVPIVVGLLYLSVFLVGLVLVLVVSAGL